MFPKLSELSIYYSLKQVTSQTLQVWGFSYIPYIVLLDTMYDSNVSRDYQGHLIG